MIQTLLSLLINVSAFLAILTLVVTIHELGHFCVARSFGVAVDRFAIGFGKPIWKHVDRHGIEWRIGCLPIGGYVRFSGDADASSSVPDAEDLNALRQDITSRLGAEAVSRFFHFKPVWQRALVVAAGPFANFALSIALFAALVSYEGRVDVTPRIGQVAAHSPAEKAGLKKGDLIMALDGHPIADYKDIGEYVHLRAGDPIVVAFQRDGRAAQLTVTPARMDRTDEVTGRSSRPGVIGVYASMDRADYHQVRVSPIAAVAFGCQQTWGIIDTTVTYVGRIIVGKESPNQLSSFVGMAQTAGAVAKAGAASAPDLPGKVLGVVIYLLSLSALISTAIGFMNLLPVPVLDGGHLVFYAYEAVARRPVGARIQVASYRIGIALLLGLMLFATWNDLQQMSLFKLLGLSS